jgi:hypothetical protein
VGHRQPISMHYDTSRSIAMHVIYQDKITGQSWHRAGRNDTCIGSSSSSSASVHDTLARCSEMAKAVRCNALLAKGAMADSKCHGRAFAQIVQAGLSGWRQERPWMQLAATKIALATTEHAVTRRGIKIH